VTSSWSLILQLIRTYMTCLWITQTLTKLEHRNKITGSANIEKSFGLIINVAENTTITSVTDSCYKGFSKEWNNLGINDT